MSGSELSGLSPHIHPLWLGTFVQYETIRSSSRRVLYGVSLEMRVRKKDGEEQET